MVKPASLLELLVHFRLTEVEEAAEATRLQGPLGTVVALVPAVPPVKPPVDGVVTRLVSVVPESPPALKARTRYWYWVAPETPESQKLVALTARVATVA